MAARIALLTDIHANRPALEAALADLDRRHAAQPFDAVYCLGDLGGYAAEPEAVQDLLAARGYPTVLGNYDDGVGFGREDCGCKYVTPFDIAMSDRSFRWTLGHTDEAHRAWLRSLPREIRFEAGACGCCSATARPATPPSTCSRPAPTATCASSRREAGSTRGPT